jgi:hypothetical protein
MRLLGPCFLPWSYSCAGRTWSTWVYLASPMGVDSAAVPWDFCSLQDTFSMHSSGQPCGDPHGAFCSDARANAN